MNEEFSKEDRIAFLKKKNEARKIASKLDWDKDKAMSYGSKPGYRYLSVEKMKRNLLPVFMGVGLDFKFDYTAIEDRGELGSMPVHWTIKCQATLTDIDTGYSETTTVFGESGDVLDKGLSKASTYALKTWLADTFMLIDGVDPDQAPDVMNVKTFVPKTDKEQDEIKSKAFANAIPPTPVKTEETVEPTAPIVKENIAVPTPVVPTPAVPSAPKPPTPKPPTPAAPKPPTPATPLKPGEIALQKLKEEKIANFEPSIPQQNAIRIRDEYYSKKAKDGRMTQDEYEAYCKDRSEIGNNNEAIAFIKKWKVDE